MLLQKRWVFYGTLILVLPFILIYPILVAFSPHLGIEYCPLSFLTVIVVVLIVLPILIRSERSKRYGKRDDYGGVVGETKLQKLIAKIPVFIALYIIFGIALIIRAVLPYATVFNDTVRFASDDAVFHMRLVENALFGEHFPRALFFDAFTTFPYGTTLHFAPLFGQLMIHTTWIIGLGSPTRELMEAVGAYTPAILGALVIFPVYIIGRELYNKYAGMIAALLVATLPGQFLSRSILGFTDHHVLETLLVAMMMMFLILALKSGRDIDIARSPRPGEWLKIKNKNFAFLCYAALIILLFYILPWYWWLFYSFIFFLLAPAIFAFWKRPDSYVLYSVLAGMALGFYLLAWFAGLLFIFVIFAYGLIQYTVNGLRGEPNQYLCTIFIPVFLVPLLMILPFFFGDPYPYDIRHIGALSVGFITFSIPLLYRYLTTIRLKDFFAKYSDSALDKLVLVRYEFLLPLFIVSVFSMIAIAFFPEVLGAFDVLTPRGPALTIGEVHPMDPDRAWIWFFTTFYIALIAMVILAVNIVKRNRSEELLLLVWSLITFILVGGLGTFGIEGIGQNRFAYYYVLNAAILTGLFSVTVFGFLTGNGTGSDIDSGWRTVKRGLSSRADARSDKSKSKSKNGSKKGGRARRAESRPDFDLRLTVFAIAVMVIAVISLIHVGIESLIPLAVIAAIFFGWLYAANIRRADIERPLSKTLALLLIMIIVFYPFPLNALAAPFPSVTNLPLSAAHAIATAERGIGAEENWYEALRWMRNNTPDPGVNFFGLYELPPINETTGRREAFDYPAEAYGVMSWWDYGHMITWVAHRIPNANPFQQGIGGPIGTDKPGAAAFFITTDENDANEMADTLGVRYVMTGFMMADIWNALHGKYGAMTVWAGDPVRFNTLAYYKDTMIAGLHIFDGAGANVDGISVSALNHYRLIHESSTFILPVAIMDAETERILHWTRIAGDYGTTATQAENLHGGVGIAGQPDIRAWTPEYIRPTSFVKTFEFVEGARIEGTAPDGSLIEISTEVRTNQGRRFTYSLDTTAVDGSYKFIVPYSTEGPIEGGTNFAVSIAPYIIRVGTVDPDDGRVVWEMEKEVRVPEEAVMEGRTIRVDFV